MVARLRGTPLTVGIRNGRSSSLLYRGFGFGPVVESSKPYALPVVDGRLADEPGAKAGVGPGRSVDQERVTDVHRSSRTRCLLDRRVKDLRCVSAGGGRPKPPSMCQPESPGSSFDGKRTGNVPKPSDRCCHLPGPTN